MTVRGFAVAALIAVSVGLVAGKWDVVNKGNTEHRGPRVRIGRGSCPPSRGRNYEEDLDGERKGELLTFPLRRFAVSLGLSGPCSGRRAGPGGFVLWFRNNFQPREIKASRAGKGLLDWMEESSDFG